MSFLDKYFDLVIYISITFASFKRQILKSYFQVLVEMSRVQDSEVGDGTTSVTVLASELIREAEKLVDMRIHPQVTCQCLKL